MAQLDFAESLGWLVGAEQRRIVKEAHLQDQVQTRPHMLHQPCHTYRPTSRPIIHQSIYHQSIRPSIHPSIQPSILSATHFPRP